MTIDVYPGRKTTTHITIANSFFFFFFFFFFQMADPGQERHHPPEKQTGSHKSCSSV